MIQKRKKVWKLIFQALLERLILVTYFENPLDFDLEFISQNFPRTGKLLDLEKHSCQKKHKTIFLTFCYFIVEKTSTPKTQKVYL